MNVIICLDDNGGMLFNNRRQSRDSVLLSDVGRDERNSGGVLYITPFSEKLFSQTDLSFKVDENMLSSAKENDLCFVENLHLSSHIGKIDTLTVYRWNRKYPADFSLDIDIEKCGFRLIATSEFVGSSHEKITKEIYKK